MLCFGSFCVLGHMLQGCWNEPQHWWLYFALGRWDGTVVLWPGFWAYVSKAHQHMHQKRLKRPGLRGSIIPFCNATSFIDFAYRFFADVVGGRWRACITLSNGCCVVWVFYFSEYEWSCPLVSVLGMIRIVHSLLQKKNQLSITVSSTFCILYSGFRFSFLIFFLLHFSPLPFFYFHNSCPLISHFLISSFPHFSFSFLFFLF